MPADSVSLLLYLSSLASIIGMAILAYAYRMSLFSNDHAVRWFARSMVLLAVVYMFRRTVWDLVIPASYGIHLENPAINILANCISLLAVYAGLQARLYLIEPSARYNWRWWNAWAHPKATQIRPLQQERKGNETDTPYRT